jgi:hypothetical protein
MKNGNPPTTVPLAQLDRLIDELLAGRPARARHPETPFRTIVGLIEARAPDTITPLELADELGMTPKAAAKALNRLWKLGYLRRVEVGVYAAIVLDRGTPTTEVEP